MGNIKRLALIWIGGEDNSRCFIVSTGWSGSCRKSRTGKPNEGYNPACRRRRCMIVALDQLRTRLTHSSPRAINRYLNATCSQIAGKPVPNHTADDQLILINSQTKSVEIGNAYALYTSPHPPPPFTIHKSNTSVPDIPS